MDYITGERLHHRGENIDGEPVGYTVDSYSDDGRIAGEYSRDKKYFSALKKPEQDIIHAYEEFPGLERLYLFAGIEATPKQGVNMANLCNKYKKSHKITIKWHDSRSIAEIITDNIRNKSEILKKIIAIEEEFARAIGASTTRKIIPELPDNFSYPQKTEEYLLEKLEENHFLYLHGISGIGKTMLSVYLQKKLLKKVQIDNVEFINVSKISAMEELRQFKDPMYGYGIDLLYTIQNEKSIFILDDLSKDLDKIVTEIARNTERNSYVIITSQLACRAAQSKQLSYEMENLDFETACRVFSYNLKNPGTEDQMKLLYNKTAGYPILLNAVRALMQFEGMKWEELEEELSNVPDYEVEEGIKLTIKLLKRHQDVLSKELFAIYWLKSNYISRPLLKKFISAEGIRKLKVRSFIQELPGIIKIHDIVYKCIHSLDFESETNKKASLNYQETFYRELDEGIERKDAEYYQMLHLHEDKILSIAQESTVFGREIYFYLQAFQNDEKSVVKEYGEQFINGMIQKTADPYVYKSIMEWYELQLRKMRRIRADENKYLSQVQIYIKNLGLMLGRLNKSDRLYTDLLHHQGKLYHNIKNDDAARKCFEEVLLLNPNAYESKLQIARISDKRSQNKERIDIYKEILDYYINGGKISMSVVLAAYEDIAFNLDEEIKEQYFIKNYEAFKKAITSLAGTTYDQPYIVLANISKVYTYDYPNYLKELLDELHLPSIEKIQKRNFFNIARMYMEFGKALRNLERDNEEAEIYFRKAEYFFENIESNIHLSSFQVVKRAESFLLLKKYEDALRFLDEHVYEEEEFWWYRKSCAFLWLDQYENAQISCDKALDIIEQKPQKNKYLSTFYRKRAQIAFYCHEDEQKILSYLNMAVKSCDEGKYKEQLKEEMSAYQNEKKLMKD